MNPDSPIAVPFSTPLDNPQLNIVASEPEQVDRLPSPKLKKIAADLIFNNLVELDKSVPSGSQHLHDTDMKLPMRSLTSDTMYEISFRKWFKHLMRTVVGGEKQELSPINAHFDDGMMLQTNELGTPSGELSDWGTFYYSEKLLLTYYKRLPKSHKDFLYSVRSDDVLSVLYEEDLHINLKGVKSLRDMGHMLPLYQEIYEVYIIEKALEELPVSKRPKEKSFVMDLFSRINSGRNLLDNLTEKLLPFIQKSILRSNSHTELNRLFLSAEMAVLDAQPVCSIGDEFILSLAYLDWLFSLPPTLPLSSLQTGQLSTIRASNVDALFSKLVMYMIQNITFSVPPIDELHTSIHPLFIWFLSSGIFNGYSSIADWSSPTLATLSPLTLEDYAALCLTNCVTTDLGTEVRLRAETEVKKAAEAEAEAETDTDTNTNIVMISGYYWRGAAADAVMTHELLEFLEKNPFINQSPYKDVIEAFPPVKNIIGRDLQTQLTVVQRSILPLSSEVIFIRILLESIYLVGPQPSYTATKRRTCAYSYVPYEMLTFLSPSSAPGLHWDQSIYILIRHVLDYIIVRDVNKGLVYSAIYNRFMQFYEQCLKEVSNCQNKSPEQLDDIFEAQLNDIFNLEIFKEKIYFKQSPQSQPLAIPANASRYFSTLIVRGVLSRLPAHSKVLVKLLLHIAISFMVYLRVITDYQLYVNTPEPPMSDPSTTFSRMTARLSHTPSWRMFLLVVDSFARFLASGQLKVDVLDMFFITHMNYKDCVDTFELDSVFEEDAVISPEAAKNAQDLTKLILTRTLQIFYTQFMREEAQWAIQRGVPTRKLDQLVHILHSSHPVIFYFYNLTVLLRAYEQDSTKPIISKSIPSSDLPYVVKYLQSLLPDVKFYKQIAGPHDVESCIYAVSAAKTLIVPLPLPLDGSNKASARFAYRISQAQSTPENKDSMPLEDISSRWSVLKEVQQSWTCIYLRHKSIYTLDPIREENLAIYFLYRVVYNMVICRAHGNISVIEKILTSKVLPDKYLHNNQLFNSIDFAYIRKYIAESNRLADELELRVQRTYKSCSLGILDLFSQSLLPVAVDFTFKDCVRSAVLRALMLRLITLFDADLSTLDFSPFWAKSPSKKDASVLPRDIQEEPYVFGGDLIMQHSSDNTAEEVDSKIESHRDDVGSTTLEENSVTPSSFPSNEDHPVASDDVLSLAVVLDSLQSLHKADLPSFVFKHFAQCSQPYPAPQWNLNFVDPTLLAFHQQQSLSLKCLLFPGFYLPHELSLLLTAISELGQARYIVGLEDADYTPVAISFALLVQCFVSHLSAGDLLLLLIACTGASICHTFSNKLYLEMCLQYPIFHQLLSTRILEDILAYLPENLFELLGLSLEYVDPMAYLRRDDANTATDLTADQQELLELMARAIGLHPSCVTLLRLLPGGVCSFFDSLKATCGSFPKIAVIVAKQGIPDSSTVSVPNSQHGEVISLKDVPFRDLIDRINGLLASGLSGRHVAACLGLKNLEADLSRNACLQNLAFVYSALQILVVCSMYR
ncbi:Hypothetical protein DHA2_152204 [Giardia duodenalis]|uniref:Uncharacterized protein n=1 Tax=Giardia intestinalis TaxID=5741 RepID=V6THJ1_GIAIN|nr:Hypothetical protein DHA2_152204 [Giardia intestinalis]